MPVTVAEIMKPVRVVLDEGAQMARVEAELRIADVRHVLITNEYGRLSGILSRGDVMRALAQASGGAVTGHMTRRVYTVRPDDPAVKAVDLMIERNVGAIPVLDDDDRPVGMVTETAVLERARTALAGA